MKSEICSRCGEEVRYGVRGTTTGWLHRQDGDHVAILGRIATDEEKARWEAELDVERKRMVTRSKGKGDDKVYWDEEETYTVRALDLERWRKSKKFKAQEDAEAARAAEDDDDDDVDPPDALPEPEVAQHDVTIESFPPRSGIRQILNLLEKTDRWKIVNITASRGPYLGAGGEVLSISDAVVIRAREVDGDRVAVASWRDGAFDFAYTGTLKGGVVTSTAANSMALKAWIKETSP